jgi:hypothetical protein
MGCIAVLAMLGPCRFNSGRICTDCGRLQHTSERQLPLTSITYWSSTWIEETPLSKMADAGLIGPHAHHWLYANGGGNGVVCAIGDGRHIVPAIHQPAVASFLRCVAAYLGPEQARRWLSVALNPERSMNLHSAIMGLGFPADGFSDSARFKAWWEANRATFDEITAK